MQDHDTIKRIKSTVKLASILYNPYIYLRRKCDQNNFMRTQIISHAKKLAENFV